MEYSGCYESVMEVVEEASAQFAGLYKQNRGLSEKLDKICEAVDEFVEELDCTFVDVSVDSNSKQLVFDIGCDEVIFEHGRSAGFFTLIQKFSSFSFSKTKLGGLCIALNLDGLWELGQD